MLVLKMSREFKNSTISSPSIDMSRPSIATHIALLSLSLLSFLVYPYFELGIEQDTMHKPLLIKK